MSRIKHWMLTLSVLLLWGGFAAAQAPGGGVSFTATLNPPQCSLGEQVVLELRLSGAVQNPVQPDVPAVPGLVIQPAGTSNSFTSINGVTSSACTFTYLINPTRTGDFTIPAVTVSDGVSNYSTQPQSLSVSASAAPVPSAPPQPAPGGMPWGGPPGNGGFAPTLPTVPRGAPVLVEAEVSNSHPYVNEAVIYTFRLLHRVSLMGQPNYEPASATGVLREDLGQSHLTQTVERNGERYNMVEVRTAFFPISPGDITIGPTRLTCQLEPDWSDPSAGLSMGLDPVKQLNTDPILLHVKPIPVAGRPPSFKGAVGHNFNWNVSLNKDSVKVGEPARLSLSITGDCHPDLLLDPVLPSWPGLRSYTPESQSGAFNKTDLTVNKTWTYSLAPLQPGSHKLDGIVWSYFDTNKARYVTLNAPLLTLQATGQAARPSDSSLSTGGPGGAPAESELTGPWTGMQLTLPGGQGPAAPVAATIPWLFTGLAYALSRAGAAHQARQQTVPARLRRAANALRRASDPSAVHAAAYAALEVQHGRPLSGLTLAQQSEVLPPAVSAALAELEAMRYAPPGSEASGAKRVSEMRDVLLKALLS